MQVPQWPAPGDVHALCSEREGGVSPAPYDSLNLGDHVGDAPAHVAANRVRFAAALGGARPVFLKQVHGTKVIELTADTPDGTEADACWTRARGIACTIQVADCLPVLMTAHDGSVVGAAHCGWRGLAGVDGQGALENLVAALREQGALDFVVWLGPCIGPGAFEVGAEVREAFAAAGVALPAERFRPGVGGKFLADLPALARDRLRALGIDDVDGNDGSAAWCTVTQASRFFSHRRDRVSGRFAASVWRA